MPLGKLLLAEFIGTFALIFIGAGAVTVLAPNDLIAIALAHGLVIMTFAYAFARDSYGYINPALVVGSLVAGVHSARDAIAMIVVQLLGGIAGALLLGAIYGFDAPNHLGATLMDLNRTTVLGGFVLEAIGTFFLANSVLNTAIRGAAGNLAPFAIGMTLSICIMAFGPITGGSLNPARTLGPAVASGDFSLTWVYVLAQVCGGVVAGLMYRFVWKEKQATQETDANVPELSKA